MHELYILLGAGLVTCITQWAKRYKANPLMVVGLLSVLGGVVATAYEYYATEEIKAFFAWAIPMVGTSSIGIYEIGKVILNKIKK